jgi:hypothetical protein
MSLQHRKWKPLEARRQDEHIEGREVRARVFAPALPDNAPVDSEPPAFGLKTLPLASVSDNDERRALDVAKSAQQHIETLLLLEPPYRADDRARPCLAPGLNCDVRYSVVDCRD